MTNNLKKIERLRQSPMYLFPCDLSDILEDFEKRITVLQEYTYGTTPIGTDNQIGGVDDVKIFPYIDKVSKAEYKEGEE